MTTSKVELYSWQKGHAQKLHDSLSKYGVAKDGSDTGTGKTVVAVKVIKDLGLAPFVICPKAVIPSWSQWVKELFPYLDPSQVVHNYEKLKGGKTLYVKRKGKGYEWQINRDKLVIVFDEDHYCKGEKSLNSKMLRAAKRQGYKLLCLGATSCSSPLDMKALGYALDLHVSSDFWSWCQQNRCRPGQWGGLEYFGGDEHKKKLHDMIYAKGSRISIADLPAGTFPDNLVSPNIYEMKNVHDIDVLYEDIMDEIEQLEDEEDDRLAITKILDERREIEHYKVDLFADLAQEYLKEGNSVVVFVNFTDTLEQLAATMSSMHDVNPLTVYGGQSSTMRQASLELFQSNKSKMLIATIQSGGVGINLHDVHGGHPRRTIMSPTFSAIDMKQALGRCYRAGGMTPVIQNLVFAANTVEEYVYRKVKAKINNIDLINDRDVTPCGI